jgi:N-acetylmuramoyl-L-alanine amidase
LKITDALLTMGANHGRTGKAITPQGIVVHYTGKVGSSAMSHRDYYERGSDGSYFSSHYIVGLKGEILRCIPENEVAQHAGVAYNSAYLEQTKKNNRIYFGIIACHPTMDGGFSDITNLCLIELCADLCVRYKLDPQKRIFTHNEVTGKLCPIYYVHRPEEWKKFKDNVKKTIEASNLAPGVVNLDIDGVIHSIQVENKEDGFYTSLHKLATAIGPNAQANIRGVLEANGYSVSWNSDLLRITARNNKVVDFHEVKEML